MRRNTGHTGLKRHLRNVWKAALSLATIFALICSFMLWYTCVAVLDVAATVWTVFVKGQSSTINSSWHLSALARSKISSIWLRWTASHICSIRLISLLDSALPSNTAINTSSRSKTQNVQLLRKKNNKSIMTKTRLKIQLKCSKILIQTITIRIGACFSR